jgi:hypothetical protein
MKAEKKFLYSKRVVLCRGEIKNIRLLQFLQKQGKIFMTLPIGLRFMRHLKGIVCKIKLNEPVSVEDSVFQFSDKISSGFTGHIGFRFTNTYVTENKLSNT